TNQTGELTAIIITPTGFDPFVQIQFVTDSEYVMRGLTEHLQTWEDDGWINVANSGMFRKAADPSKCCSAPASYQWVKGHNGDKGNEEADSRADQGARKDLPFPLDLSITNGTSPEPS
ncbi:hypothetical protein FA95DRAFT_1490982, partial [Auriscalpium vulgare]